jgi:hypothetical protein
MHVDMIDHDYVSARNAFIHLWYNDIDRNTCKNIHVQIECSWLVGIHRNLNDLCLTMNRSIYNIRALIVRQFEICL